MMSPSHRRERRGERRKADRRIFSSVLVAEMKKGREEGR